MSVPIHKVGSPGKRRWIPLVFVILIFAGLFVVYWIGSDSEPEGLDSRLSPSGAEFTEPVQVGPIRKISRAVTPEETVAEKVDPKRDEWDTETLSESAMARLGELGSLLERGEPITAANLKGWVTGDFGSTDLAPSPLKELYRTDQVEVRRWEPEALARTHLGADGFARILNVLAAHLGAGERIRTKFKLFRIEKEEDFFTTRVLFEASVPDRRQHNATWRCRFRYPGPEEPPLFLSLDLEEYEQVAVRNRSGSWFEDCTQSAIGANESYRRQMIDGTASWLPKISRISGVSLIAHHGLAVGDVNGDGLEDLYACDTGGLPNRLYVQNPDGTLTDRSRKSGVDWLDFSVAALFVDLDNDGDQDLVVGTRPTILIAENDGKGVFSLRLARAGVSDPTSLCSADHDQDGDLDLFICGYLPDPMEKGLPGPYPYHDANNGGANALWRNEGDFEFQDVTEECGLDANNSRFSFAASFEDYDNDGDVDLYVANDFGRNNLYRNDGGHFVDVAPEAGVEDIASGMSVSFGDYDRNGWMDLYVGNMFSAAGNRVTYQRRFSDGSEGREETVTQIRRMARGNTLFANVGEGRFEDVSEAAGVTMGRWAWASRFADLNNDGWQDIVVANGYVTGQDSGDL